MYAAVLPVVVFAPLHRHVCTGLVPTSRLRTIGRREMACTAGKDDRDICYFRAVGDEKSFTTKICSEGLLGHVDASSMACCK